MQQDWRRNQIGKEEAGMRNGTGKDKERGRKRGEREDEEEEWEETLSTEVFVLRIHQEWCSKKTWQMWAPTETRQEVATRWLRRRRLEGAGLD